MCLAGRLFGTFVFCVPEIVHGFPNVPVDRNFEFTFHYNMYFWFGFVAANCIWVVVPTLVIVNALKRSSEVSRVHDLNSARWWLLPLALSALWL